MLYNKIEKKINIQTIVAAQNYKPLIIFQKPYEEMYTFWQLFYVRRGQAEIVREGKSETIKAGEIIFRPPNQKSTMIYPNNCELHMGLIDFICTDSALNYFGTHPISIDEKEKKLINDVIEEASHYYKDCYSNSLWPELISSALENFLIRLFGRLNGIFPFEAKTTKRNTKNNTSAKVEQINHILEERRFGTVTIEEIAYVLHDSPNTLMKCYKKEMNQSIMEHFLDLKLETAKQLISLSELNFTEISEILGFSSVNYFSKFFKKRCGMTPTEFSKQI